MMFLYNGMRAEVEPVPKKKGWYQLTGKHIERWTMPVEETAGDLHGVKLNFKARIVGIHDIDPEIELRDPRFNHENHEDRASFFVYTDPHDGRTYMLLAVNQAEYVLFRFLAPHESGEDEDYDPIENYRVEPKVKAVAKKAVAAQPVAKKVAVKKAAAKGSKATAQPLSDVKAKAKESSKPKATPKAKTAAKVSKA
jgi:hypothetical protein